MAGAGSGPPHAKAGSRVRLTLAVLSVERRHSLPTPSRSPVLDVFDVNLSLNQAGCSRWQLDVLVNSAGILGDAVGVDDLDADVMRSVLETNVVGIVRVTQAALALLRRSANPVIVNVASGVGLAALPGHRRPRSGQFHDRTGRIEF